MHAKRRSERRGGAAVAVALIVGSVSAATVAPAAAATDPSCTSDGAGSTTCTTTFDFTGALESFTVPEGITSLDVVAVGAAGGDGQSAFWAPFGGVGATAAGSIDVVPGSTLFVAVGGRGASHSPDAPTAPGGFNGGGRSGFVDGTRGGAGGGASDVRTDAADLATRLVVAGGGGGGAGASAGGAAGQSAPERGGIGATQSGPGAGAPEQYGAYAGESGTFGSGGAGGDQIPTSRPFGAGGGGGGWYGGGGGSGSGGGGGGSSYLPGGTFGLASSRGDGSVTLWWTFAPAEVRIVSGDAQSALAGAAFAEPLVVQVVDQSGAPVQDAPVTFVVTSGAATPSEIGAVATDADGRAAIALAAGATTGPVSVTASVPGLPTALFSATVTRAPALSGTPGEAVVGEAYEFAFDVSGSPMPTVSVTGGALPDGLSVSSAGVLSGRPTAAGSFSFQLTAVSAAGSTQLDQTVTVSAGPAHPDPDTDPEPEPEPEPAPEPELGSDVVDRAPAVPATTAPGAPDTNALAATGVALREGIPGVGFALVLVGVGVVTARRFFRRTNV